MSAPPMTNGRLALIADGDAERGKRLVEACAARGIEARFADHGAGALELALLHVPDVLVVSDHLSVVPSVRLTEILRANPRTHGTRIVWLGDLVDGIGPAFADELIEPPVEPEDVARRIDTLLARRGRADGDDGARDGEREMQGKLAQIALADLIELFHLNRRSGVLELLRRESPGREERARVELRDGQVVHAVVGAVEGEKAFFRLLAWRSGRFAFSDGDVPGPARIRTPTRALLMEGMRQLDEQARLGERLPPLDAEVQLRVRTADLPAAVQPLTQEVLLLVEIYSDVRDVVDHCTQPDFAVLRTLQALAERGLVELRRPRPRRLDASGSGSFFTPAQVRRLREGIDPARNRARADLEAKLVVTASRPEAVARFLRWLRHVPGSRPDPALRNGAPAATDLVPLARVSLDPTTALEIVQLPIAPAFEAVWPFVAARAAAVVHLVDGPVDEAEQRLAPIVRVLSMLPGARAIPVRLSSADVPDGADVTQERLSIFGNVSPVFAAPDGVGDPQVVLRDLFARVIA